MSLICLHAVCCVVATLAFGASGPVVADSGPEGDGARLTLDLPGLTLDAVNASVLLDAEVVGQDADWLELVACPPKSREHEALVTVVARPSHVHLALATLGAQPGNPRTAHREGPGDWQVEPARGPELIVTVAYDTPDGRVETPIQSWYAAKPPRTKPDAPPDTAATRDDRFMFTGSQTRTHEGQTFYLADLSGSLISLVHFGDDTVARHTGLTQDTDGQALVPTAAVPPNGTTVVLRIRVAEPAPPADRPSSTPPAS